MRALGPEYYDDAIANPASPHLGDHDTGPYAALYDAIAATLARMDNAGRLHVVDIGCGPGRLAARIVPEQAREYIGLDFSPGMLQEARDYTAGISKRLTFTRWDARHKADRDKLHRLGNEHTVYIASEVLEHLDDDRGVLQAIPLGARVIVSVPSTDSKAHVRYFTSRHVAKARYSRQLAITNWERVWAPEQRGYWHLMTGRRRNPRGAA